METSPWDEEFDLELPSGRLHAARAGGDGPVVLCLPGLSANLRGFDLVAGHLATLGFRVVAVDLRGRGRSEETGPGTYGWPAHAADAAAIGKALGSRPVAVVGWSMGAYVALQLAALEPDLLSRVVLIDACGPASPEAEGLIRLALDRLGAVYPSLERYIELIRTVGVFTPWDALWERYFAYELEAVEGGVRARTSRAAVLEDFEYGSTHDPRELWPALPVPSLLVRASRPLVPGGPFIVTEADRDAFAQSVPRSIVVEVDANHYSVVTNPAAIEATGGFLQGVG